MIRGALIRLDVERLLRPMNAPTPLWSCYHGFTPPDLAEVWQAYIARFSLEHTFRFFKKMVHWTPPKLRSPAAVDRWTWLLMRAYLQWRLARGAVADVCLPWQPSLPTEAIRTSSHTWVVPPTHQTLWALGETPLRQVLSACTMLSGRQTDALIHLTLRLFALVLATT